MRSKMVCGALMMSLVLSSQAFGLDLLERMSGLNGGCQACAAPAAAPCAPCAPVKAVKPCGPEVACETCAPCARRCDLFRGLKDLFACQRCGKVNCACEKACGPAPCAKVAPCAAPAACAAPAPCAPACEKACERPILRPRCRPVCEKVVAVCEKPAPCAAPAPCAPACEKGCAPSCEKAPRCRCGRHIGHGLVLGVLGNIFSCKREVASCETGCAACGGTAAPVTTPAPAPAAAPAPPAKPASDEAAPLPIAPKADPSASLMHPRTIYQASRIVAQN